MSTVVGIMDRNEPPNARTDINVVVDPQNRTLTWVPRDIYSSLVKNRINAVFSTGGDDEIYRRAMTELGFPVDHSIIVWPETPNRVTTNLKLEVPVDQPMRYFYPLSPWAPIEDGRKEISFMPPAEILSGERIHQWLGARYEAGARRVKFPDLDRCGRQVVFLRRLLETEFDFSPLLDGKTRASSDKALSDVRQVDASWEMSVFDQVKEARIEKMQVLVKL